MRVKTTYLEMLARPERVVPPPSVLIGDVAHGRMRPSVPRAHWRTHEAASSRSRPHCGLGTLRALPVHLVQDRGALLVVERSAAGRSA